MWDNSATSTFEILRSAIVKCTGTTWFNSSEPVVIHTDASSEGLGCTLLQNDKPVMFASRKLNPVEKRYSVIEKEFLGIVYALRKFRRLLMFNKCHIKTDHKPILGLLDKKIDNLPIRIQKWIMEIQPFDVSFDYIPGFKNVLSDAHSRNPVDSDSSDTDATEYTVCLLLRSLPISIKDVAQATSRDPLLQSVIEAIDNSWSSSKYAKLPFHSMKDELSVKVCSRDGKDIVIMKGNNVVMPHSLVREFLDQIHEGHIGTKQMIALIQSCVFWIGYTKDVKEYLKRCSACNIY